MPTSLAIARGSRHWHHWEVNVSIGYQKEIAAEIIDREGDYLLALKENHPTLCEAVAAEFTAALEADAPPRELRRHVTVETNRGREERREYFALPAPRSLPGFADWANLVTLVMVIRTTIANGKESGEVSYFLSSVATKVKTLAKLIRQHWSIENQLHWVLDVTFTEDASRIRKQHVLAEKRSSLIKDQPTTPDFGSSGPEPIPK